MGPLGEGGERGGSEYFGPPLQKIFGALLQILSISAEFSAQAQSIGTLFEQIGLSKGVFVGMSKSQRHTCSGAGRGVSESSQ